MKSFSEFNQVSTEKYSEVSEHYDSLVEQGVLTENPLLRGAARFIPGLQQGYGIYRGTKALMKGDLAGAGLGYGSALPGPLGYGFAAADIARDMGFDPLKTKPGSKQPASTQPPSSQPAASNTTQPSSTQPAKPKNTTVLALKGGVQGKLDKATGKFTPGDFTDAEKQRYTAAGGKIPGAAPKPAPKPAGGKEDIFTSTPPGGKAYGNAAKPAPTSQATAGKMTQGRPDAKIDTASVAAAMKKANSPAVLNKPAPAGSALAKQQAMNKPNALGNTQAQLNKLRADAKAATLAKSQVKKPMAGVGPRGM